MTTRTLTCLALSATLSAALSLAGCGPSVKVETSERSDLGAVRTYAWYPREGDVTGVYGGRERLAREALRSSIDEGLKRNGLRPTDADGEPDVLVTYHLGVRSRREITDTATVQRYGQTFEVPAEVTIHRAGTLLVYLFDPLTGEVAWVGSASAEAKAADSDAEVRKRLKQAVGAIFDDMKHRKHKKA